MAEIYFSGQQVPSSINDLSNLSDYLSNKGIGKDDNANELSYGDYRINGDIPANVPQDAGYGYLKCIQIAPNWELQFCITLQLKIYKRAKVNFEWSDWSLIE
ncbi:pyocin knob domain-containing protein [Lactobacillus crispatus]|uniref:pyocin knob domain-containing protein n=1 Tax=Lactobacillus crispatus TaxID=47770 RepID=UPI0022ABEE16|nr:pyocin knob domain-containing protein [Lactobacillus crispatus]MCZ3592565.1 pyocin knob domain-containing protein [Lactobacillus crispatus]MCZ3601217.1 pyocin knob domain-containing protein [Lactobacillus crispatus]